VPSSGESASHASTRITAACATFAPVRVSAFARAPPTRPVRLAQRQHLSVRSERVALRHGDSLRKGGEDEGRATPHRGAPRPKMTQLGGDDVEESDEAQLVVRCASRGRYRTEEAVLPRNGEIELLLVDLPRG
jgi:hypothetical protein